MKSTKQLALALILVLMTLVLVATTAVPSVSASASPVNMVVVNKTINYTVEIDTSNGCYNFTGNQKDVPPGAPPTQAHGNTNQTFNITLHDPRPGAGEIFVACLATHTPNTIGASTLTVVEDASGQVAVYYTRTDGWMPPLWAPRFDPALQGLVVKYAPQPTATAMSQPDFNAKVIAALGYTAVRAKFAQYFVTKPITATK